MTSEEPKFTRVVSLDVLRGFSMFLLVGGGAIFVAMTRPFDGPFPEWIQRQFTHVSWEGFHLWDLVMPLFLFVVGTSMPFSFEKRLASGTSKRTLYRHILFRVVVLWILGMIRQGNLLSYDLDNLKLFNNTLQAIAVGYLITAVILLHCKLRVQYAVLAGLLLVYWALLAWVPVPGAGAGEFTPAGNVAIYLDKLILGRFRHDVTYSWVLSSITFAATVLMGALAGQFLKTGASDRVKVAGLIGAGAACILIGWGWGFQFPIIKRIWTSSFVLYSGGMCLILLGTFHGIVEAWGLRKWAFGFVVLGSNAIVAYMADSVVDFHGIAERLVGGLDAYAGDWSQLLHAVVAFAALWLPLWYAYRHRTFVKI